MEYCNFITVDIVTGKIEAKGCCPDYMVDSQKFSDTQLPIIVPENLWKTYNYESFYYNGNEEPALAFSPRQPSSITQLDSDLSFYYIPYELPAGVQMSIDGTEYSITEDHVSLNINLPGTYKIVFTNFPYLDAVFEVTI